MDGSSRISCVIGSSEITPDLENQCLLYFLYREGQSHTFKQNEQNVLTKCVLMISTMCYTCKGCVYQSKGRKTTTDWLDGRSEFVLGRFRSWSARIYPINHQPSSLPDTSLQSTRQPPINSPASHQAQQQHPHFCLSFHNTTFTLVFLVLFRRF